MSEHRVGVTTTEHVRYSYRGGCNDCRWLGPHRETADAAQADAQLHAEHVARYPHPDVPDAGRG